MTMNKAIKHKARKLVGCGWHTRIKKSSKRDASKAARRILRHAVGVAA